MKQCRRISNELRAEWNYFCEHGEEYCPEIVEHSDLDWILEKMKEIVMKHGSKKLQSMFGSKVDG